MALTVNSNATSMAAQHNLGRTSSALGRSLEKLSSGMKINRGADGPAALVISEKQRAQIAGLNAAIANSEKAVSMVQTAEGALTEINSLLTKVRSLAIDSANAGVNDADALAANQAEISNAVDTINRIANNTQFGTKKLLDGSAGLQGVADDVDVTFLSSTSDTGAGTHAVAVTTQAERATYTAGTAQGGGLTTDETLTINGVSVSLSSGMTQTQVISRINEFTGQTGVTAEDDPAAAGKTRIRSAQFGTAATVSIVSNVAAAANTSGFGTTEKTDTGVDIAGTIAAAAASGEGNVLTATAGAGNGVSVSVGELTADKVKTVTGANGGVTITDNSLTFQIGANRDQTVSLSVTKMNSANLGVGVADNQFNSLAEIDVTSAGKSQDSLSVIDAAIDEVTNLRGTLGAFQANTLESTANNLRSTLENTTNAESVIRDTDFASEIANFTKQQIMMQSGTSALGNANQIPQLVLSLLG